MGDHLCRDAGRRGDRTGCIVVGLQLHRDVGEPPWLLAPSLGAELDEAVLGEHPQVSRAARHRLAGEPAHWVAVSSSWMVNVE